MHKLTLNIFILLSLSTWTWAQEKDDKKAESVSENQAAESEKTPEVMEKTTTMSEKTSPLEEIKIEDLLKSIPMPEPEPKPLISQEMKKLMEERKNTFLELNNADSEMNKLILKSAVWDKERNTEKKGQLDTILDKADRLAFSNELRMKMSEQAKVISSLIKKISQLEVEIQKQEVRDEKKRQMEAYKKHIDMLHKERKTLIEKLKNQNSETHVVNSTEAVQKKRDENVEYLTITSDINLQNIALQYYQDYEKWVIIFDHPDNKGVLKQKSPTAIIPIGTVLTIPKLKEE